MILCDTNIIIDFYKGNPAVIQNLMQLGADQLAVSVITKAELFFGARDKIELSKIERHLSTCHTIDLDHTISQCFTQLMRSYSLSHRASIPDMLIAATCITRQIALYTHNTKDFQFIPDIKLYAIKHQSF